MSSQTEGIAPIQIHLVGILLMLQTKLSSHINKSFIIRFTRYSYKTKQIPYMLFEKHRIKFGSNYSFDQTVEK